MCWTRCRQAAACGPRGAHRCVRAHLYCTKAMAPCISSHSRFTQSSSSDRSSSLASNASSLRAQGRVYTKLLCHQHRHRAPAQASRAVAGARPELQSASASAGSLCGAAPAGSLHLQPGNLGPLHLRLRRQLGILVQQQLQPARGRLARHGCSRAGQVRGWLGRSRRLAQAGVAGQATHAPCALLTPKVALSQLKQEWWRPANEHSKAASTERQALRSPPNCAPKPHDCDKEL